MPAANTSEPTPAPHHEIIVVGAGFAGIGAAIKLKQAGMDFIVLEKSAEIGGVWRDNSYPDCACDVPSALYSYSFAPNPRWSHVFARQSEIKAYTDDVAARFDILAHTKLNHEMRAAVWDPDARLWQIETSAGPFTARFVIFACGPMHKPVTPHIKGMESFTGTSFHSARWDHGQNLAGKRVAVIGSGASAIQFLPAIQPDVAELTLFQRTPPWVLPKMDASIPEKWQRRFARFPILQTALRQVLYLYFERLNSSLNSPRAREKLEARALKNIHRGVKDEALRQRLTPDYAIGCKRILQSNTWYRALAQPNVSVTGGVAEIRGDRVIAQDGSECQVDVIIYATGFEVANPPVAELITGASGQTLAAQWQGSPQAYLGTMAADCPNAFLTFGPNLYTFSSAFVILEAQLAYIMSALTQARSRKITTLAINPATSETYNRNLQTALATSVWNIGGCTSYFLDRNGHNATNWPWTTTAMRRRLKRFRLKDYVVSKA
tara:strand:- start:4588 stop:6066 length:1479 start_codon:yes stop_codon:yes gene_type:complete